MRSLRALPFLLLLLLLGGCSSMRLIESDVRAHSNFAGPGTAVGSFRFERLPSQQLQSQGTLEQIAAGSLAKVGLPLAGDPSRASFSAQIEARSGTWIRDDEGRLFPSTGAWGAPRFNLGIGMGRPSTSFGFMLPITYLHRHEVSLVLRDLASGLIAYETRAFHEGPWADTAVLYGVMFDAALQGFPQTSAGPRRVRIEIPR